jgi:hypothetical protein
MVTFKSLSIASVGAVLLTFGTGGMAQAILLGSATLDINITVEEFDLPFNNESKFEVRSRIGAFLPSDPIIFRGTIIRPSDVGKTFTVTQATDPEFNNFVSLLTNGRNDFVGFEYQEVNGFLGGGTARNESFFSFFIDNPTQIDFLGNTIDSISIEINSFFSNRSIFENGFISNNLTATATLSINGQPSTVSESVPESSSALSILAFAALGVGAVQKRRCCKSTR